MSIETGAERVASHPSQRSPRAAAALLGLVLFTTALVIGAAPAGAAAPGTPRIFGAAGYQSHIRLWFTAPASNGGSPITKYTISRRMNPLVVGEVPETFDVTTTGMFTDPTSLTGSAYQYTITATNADGTSAPSDGIYVTQTVGANDYSKFPSVGAFVTRQFQDVLGRAPTALELSGTTTQINKGTLSADGFFDQLFADSTRTAHLQVIRLYLAYFKRSPDHGGLAYWTREIGNGTRDINDVSNAFAASHEFKTTYGSLSNIDFVTLVYRNVLGRDPEPNGFAFWTNQLDKHLAIRGRVMTEFSESSEFKNASKGRVQAADVWDALLHANISAANLDLYSTHLDGGGTEGGLATLIVSLPQYVVS